MMPSPCCTSHPMAAAVEAGSALDLRRSAARYEPDGQSAIAECRSVESERREVNNDHVAPIDQAHGTTSLTISNVAGARKSLSQ